MIVCRTTSEMRSAGFDRPVLVPTMGALHEGHLSLIRVAKEKAQPVVVSIFVNPTQFGEREDYGRYPRNLDRDAEMAESAGADAIFHPDAREMYPRVPTTIHVPEVGELYEGAVRPGHFDGVATVVCKLFQIVRPAAAVFGLKDLQQCLVINRMVQDLNLDVGLEFSPTIREADGLAMSSRNAYLSSQERSTASAIYRELSSARDLLVPGQASLEILKRGRSNLTAVGFDLDYLDLVDCTVFRPIDRVPDGPVEIEDNENPFLEGPVSAVICAARLGTTRLIDNLLLFDTRNMP